MSKRPDKAQAWSDYWRGQKGGCLPAASPALDAVFREEWRRVADALPHGARVLDLATGDGAVLRWLAERRADLDLTGIDLAEPLPPAPPGCVTRGGIAMEALPFEDDNFDAIVSQFGFEYGDLDRSAAEAARVLRHGGSLTLIAHHADGPIVDHNRKRAAGLGWALDEARLIDRAHDPEQWAEVGQAPGVAADRFGEGSAGWQLADAIRRVVHGSPKRLDATAREMLDRLERMTRGELQRIKALEQASTAVAAEGHLEACLGAHGLRLEQRHPVMLQGLALAGHWAFRRH